MRTFSIFEDAEPGNETVFHEIVRKLLQLGALVKLLLLAHRTTHLKVYNSQHGCRCLKPASKSEAR